MVSDAPEDKLKEVERLAFEGCPGINTLARAGAGGDPAHGDAHAGGAGGVTGGGHGTQAVAQAARQALSRRPLAHRARAVRRRADQEGRVHHRVSVAAALRNAQAEKLEARGSRYMFEINSRWTIDGSSRRNIARYANHSCRPNAESDVVKGGVILRAIRASSRATRSPTTTVPEYFEIFLEPAGCKCDKCMEKRRKQRRERRVRSKRKAKR